MFRRANLKSVIDNVKCFGELAEFNIITTVE